jgi:hypothetical protein
MVFFLILVLSLVQLIEQERRQVYISVQFEMIFNWSSLSTELYFGLKVE